MTEKCIKKSMGFEWHPVAVCGITPKQNCIVTSIFYISTSNLKHNLFRHMALILCQIWIKTFCKIFYIIYNNNCTLHFIYSKFKLV